MSDGMTDTFREHESDNEYEVEKEKLQKKLKEVESELELQRQKLNAVRNVKDDREQVLLYFVNNYLKYPNERTYKQLMVLIEADFMKLGYQTIKQQEATVKK